MNALKGKRVLVVDDEAWIALFAEDMLLELGATPVGPAMSLEALARATKAVNLISRQLVVQLEFAFSQRSFP